MKYFLTWLALTILSIILPLILFANLKEFYLLRFQGYGVYQEFNAYQVPTEIVQNKLFELTNYLNFGTSELDDDFFSKEDIYHLEDVKKIVASLYYATVLVLSLFIFLIRKTSNYYKMVTIWLKSSKIFLIVATIFSVTCLLFFDRFFISAHELVFTNDYWMLDPKTSNLIKMFPQDIFYEVFVIVIAFIILNQLAIYLICKNIYGSLNHEK